jgi:hypothetical protein
MSYDFRLCVPQARRRLLPVRSQVERVLDLQKDFEASFSCYDGVSREIADHFSVQQKTPWSQFWNSSTANMSEHDGPTWI